MAAILGLSAFYHDSAAVLLQDGQIVAAAQEERFTRRKHDHHFPQHAVAYCLKEAGLTAADLDHVAFYDRPRAKFSRLVETFTAMAPAGFSTYVKALPLWMKSKLHLPREFDRALGGRYRGRYIFTDHHEAHAASAFFPSPFEEAAILTLDGAGEWSTTTLGHGKGNRIALTREIRFPHSLGLLYSAFTYYTGFRVNSGEYKVMGLAPYGEPRFAPVIREHLIHIQDDGSFWMDQEYFNYCGGVTMTSDKFHRLFGAPPRDPESSLTQRDMDLAASVQVVCEEVMLKCARHAHAITRSRNLVMAGGVALNCVGNGRILREGPFENIWIQPAAGDAGGALGAAQIAWHHVLRQPRTPAAGDSLRGSYLGPSFSNEEIRSTLTRRKAAFHSEDNESRLLDRVVELLMAGKVVGWFQGRMEFGPRALGGRSILGDPRSANTQQVMNVKIKFRESFRPFAPSVLREHCHEYFDLAHGADSPYMLIVAPVQESQRLSESAESMRGLQGIEKLNVPRSSVPSVTHVDFSARIQTVTPEANGRYYRLIKRFHEQSGCPMLVNTSFNIRGEPMVCTPDDALRCFLGTDMDALVLEDSLLLKPEQSGLGGSEIADYKRSFALD
ncbi:MAG TPA: carbamoyltransferase [Vicinamibacterales bacterium]